jgi:hypothetical protein
MLCSAAAAAGPFQTLLQSLIRELRPFLYSTEQSFDQSVQADLPHMELVSRLKRDKERMGATLVSATAALTKSERDATKLAATNKKLETSVAVLEQQLRSTCSDSSGASAAYRDLQVREGAREAYRDLQVHSRAQRGRYAEEGAGMKPSSIGNELSSSCRSRPAKRYWHLSGAQRDTLPCTPTPGPPGPLRRAQRLDWRRSRLGKGAQGRGPGLSRVWRQTRSGARVRCWRVTIALHTRQQHSTRDT